MPVPDLDETSAKVLAVLVEHYHEYSAVIRFDRLMITTGLSTDQLREILKQFSRCGLVRSETLGDEEWRIKPELLAFAEQLSQPPPLRDWPRDALAKLRSKWWSVPIFILLAVVAWLASPLSMVKTIFDWRNPSP